MCGMWRPGIDPELGVKRVCSFLQGKIHAKSLVLRLQSVFGKMFECSRVSGRTLTFCWPQTQHTS